MSMMRFFHKTALLKGLAIVLWIVISILALFALNGAVNLTVTIYAAFWAGAGEYGEVYGGAVALRQAVLIFGSFLALIAIIGNAEYQFRRFNTPGAWRVFAHTLGAEVGILLLAALL